MENLFVTHSAFIYLFICFYYYIRHYTNQNKTKGGKKRTLSLWTCLMLPLTGFACFWREHTKDMKSQDVMQVFKAGNLISAPGVLFNFRLRRRMWTPATYCVNHVNFVTRGPRLIDTTVDMPSGTKTFYHLLSTRLTHALSQRLSMFHTLSHVFTQSFMCNQVI